MLSYRHAFHAGNFADVLKHFVLVEVLRYYSLKDKPWWYIDTHAGAGCYALDSRQALQTGEHASGISRLWAREDWPAAMQPYRAALTQFNPPGHLAFYPGSAALAMTQARAQDRLRLFELHPADSVALARTFESETECAVVRAEDGFAGLRSLLPPAPRRAVVLIDPSYEVKSDYRRVVSVLEDALRRFPLGTYMVWYPMLARAEARALPRNLGSLGSDSWLDVRLWVRDPRTEATGMFGSGLYIINPPWRLPEVLDATLPWPVAALGESAGAAYFLEHEIA